MGYFLNCRDFMTLQVMGSTLGKELSHFFLNVLLSTSQFKLIFLTLHFIYQG